MRGVTHFRAAVQGKLTESLAAEQKRIQTALIEETRLQTRWLQIQMRMRLRPVFSRRGGAVVNALRAAPRGDRGVKVYVSDKNPLNVGAYVFSNWGRGKKQNFTDFFAPFVHGGRMESSRPGGWLFMPIARQAFGGRLRGARIEELLNQPGVALIRGPGGKSYVIKRTRSRDMLLGLFVRQTETRRRMNLPALENIMRRRLVMGLNRRLSQDGGAPVPVGVTARRK